MVINKSLTSSAATLFSSTCTINALSSMNVTVTPKELHGTNSISTHCGTINVLSKNLALDMSNLKHNVDNCKTTDRKISPKISSPRIEHLLSYHCFPWFL